MVNAQINLTPSGVSTPKCKHKTFIEEMHFIDGKCARRTKRLDERIGDIALKMSARSAKKVVNSGLTVISDDTILRILKNRKYVRQKRYV